jgi:two-component system response regulator FixJ
MVQTAEKAVAPTIFVVDDDDGMRRALDTLLSTVGYKTAVFSRASDFLARYTPEAQGCLVLDIRMPEMSGLEVQKHLNRMGSMLPVIFITGHGDVPMAVQAMKEHINHALKQDAEYRSTAARRSEVQHRLESLTPREKQVMELIVEGNANKVIAIDLGLSERTVEIHRAKVMEKMGARSVAHLVKLHMTLADEG